jgi:phosphoglycerate kinase
MDFTTLELHAETLQGLDDLKVKYVDDIFGPKAQSEINNLNNGEILLLENVRFCSEENSPEVISQSPFEQLKTNFVRQLSSSCNFFVNDAFAVSHRTQPSVVAFPYVMPSCAGNVMELEIISLSKVRTSNKSPKTFLFGGVKARDSLQVIKRLLEAELADFVLTSGIVGNLFLTAEGINLGNRNKEYLSNCGIFQLIPLAKELLKRYREKIKFPIDLAFEKKASRVESESTNFPNFKIMDIGIETIAEYTNIIEESKVVVANGPCGVFEIDSFAIGTEEILKAMAKSKGFSVIGGGHLSTSAQNLDLTDKISYISTGGKATMYFLAGYKLPGIEALKIDKLS